MILTEEKYLLSQLLTHKKLDLYSFYKSTSFSTGQIVRAVFKYQRKGYLIILGRHLFRTPYGKYKIRKMRLTTLNQVERYWANVPEEFIQEKVLANEPIDRIRIPK